MTFFQVYNRILKTHPYKANMFTTGMFFGVGDCLAQVLYPHHIDDDENKPTEYNPYRTLRACIYGSCFFGPLSTKWQTRILPSIRNPLITRARRARLSDRQQFFRDNLFRLSIDALVMPGLVWIPLYNTAMSTLALHDDPLMVAKEKLQANWWNVLRASWIVWLPLQVFNLFFVPVHMRVVLANIWSIGWNCFLSFCHNTKGHGKESGRVLESIVDIETADEEQTMVYV